MIFLYFLVLPEAVGEKSSLEFDVVFTEGGWWVSVLMVNFRVVVTTKVQK